jgi:hypothetical protein
MNKLTGNKRYRIHTQLWCDPVLVLQVEYEYEHATEIDLFTTKGKAWRDAKLEDLTQFKE